MEQIKLVTDSSSDIAQEIRENYQVGITRLNVMFGDEDVSDISNPDFYARMKISPILPKTSAPSPERFLEQIQTDRDVLIITLAEKLSSTFNAAKLARDMHRAEGGTNRIAIIDSLNGSLGATSLVYTAGEMIRQGKTLDEIEQAITNLRDSVVHFGMLETLENAIKGGRVNRTAGFIANALNIKALVEIRDGVVKPIDKARGTKNALKKLIDTFLNKIEERSVGHHYTTLFLAHANAPERINMMLEELKGRFEFERIFISEIGPLMGTYTAGEAVLIAAI